MSSKVLRNGFSIAWKGLSLCKACSARAFRLAVMFCVCASMAACSDESTPKKPATKSGRQICDELARGKEAELGKKFPYYDEDFGYTLIGDTVLKFPREYVHSFNYGSSLNGQGAILEAYLPTLSGDPDEVYSKAMPGATNVLIYIDCVPPEKIASRNAGYGAMTRDSNVPNSYFEVPYDDPAVRSDYKSLGLVMFKPKQVSEEVISEYFLPRDEAPRNPSGGVLGFRCRGYRYENSFSWCLGGFFYPPNLQVKYNFPYSFLSSWRPIIQLIFDLIRNGVEE